MMMSALVSHLQSNLSTNRVFVGDADANTSLPCVVIDDLGDFRNRHYSESGIQTGLIEGDYELTAWASTPLAAKRLADEILTLLDNFAGPMRDTTVSPVVIHRVALIEATNNGSDINEVTKHRGHSVFLSITHA